METKSDKEVLDISLTRAETRKTRDAEGYEGTDTADEEREPVLGDQADRGRADESGDMPGLKTISKILREFRRRGKIRKRLRWSQFIKNHLASLFASARVISSR